jgi:hypothetical protein
MTGYYFHHMPIHPMLLKKILPVLVILLMPFLFALMMPFFFDQNVFLDPVQPLSIIAMAVLPILEGLLVIVSSPLERVRKPAYRFFMPWVAILFFFIISFILQVEDCACWTIGLPIFLLLSSAGGGIAGYLKLRKEVN